ncbi:tumor necrosis factor receptor superfamily member 11A isoform X2 [Hypomesus transpacificus]|uniref:tumor necrosis factor receptor superfamily member 11A isoform X2 n=1 Tax=Hypomesus transpacificus TaxID=137520 RepID=UPI001F07A46C|nr:tumor necrosis factor receptor superfamily member 11A isoform X2 [Hypomesus transpacificus]
MRVNFSTNWIFQGWITHLIFVLCAQKVCSRPAGCGQNKYQKNGRCCSMCSPGTFALKRCSMDSDTACRPCGADQYQPDWNNHTKCQLQKLCDTGKGFSSERPKNALAPEPCRCISGRQCSPIKCEFCEKIPSCGPGSGQETLTESGRKICMPCKRGFFSSNTSIEPCKPWTNCKAQGRTEEKHGSDGSDAVCGAGDSSTSWVVVSILSNIAILSLFLLLLFCYKDKLKILSVNLRSCVQNLKRTRIQQETLAPLYNSGGGGGGDKSVIQSCPLCETTSLIQDDPCTPSEPPLTCSRPAPALSIKLPLTPPRQGEEEGGEEGSCASPLLACTCVCVPSVREPLEVGENEDCSQAVNPGTLGPCYCRGGQGEEGGREEGEEGEMEEEGERDEEGEGERDEGEGVGTEGQQSTSTQGGKSQSGTTTPPSSLPPSPLLSSSLLSPADLSPDLCPPLTQARAEVRGQLTDRSLQKGRGLYGLKDGLGSAPGSDTVPSPPPTVTSLTLTANGEPSSEPSSEASTEELDQGLSLRASGGDKLSPRVVDLEFSPENLQSDLAETALTSGQVSGNHNTTFISSGQVMNFSGEVVVVYVSQTSLGNAGAGLDNAFGNPVQEQANENAWLFQSLTSKIPTLGISISHNSPQDDNLPVQEVTNDWPREK